MENFNKVAIDINENGYTVTVLQPQDSNGKQFVFSKAKQMRNWLKNNLSPTGEVERFSNALDNDPENDTIGNGWQYTIGEIINGTVTTTTLAATS